MIRIVGIQKSGRVEEEFVLLQNQGNMRTGLRGHLLLEDTVFEGSQRLFVFSDTVSVQPGQFVLLRSCAGVNGWRTGKDGAYVYYVYASSSQPLWSADSSSIHVLSIDHTYAERREHAVMV